MAYDEKYFINAKKSYQGKFSFLSKFFSKNVTMKNSQAHLKLYLNNRWEPLKNCKKVLDIGCGEGEFIKLNPFNIEVYGADISKDIVKELQKDKIKVSVQNLNKKLAYKDNFFDGIACFHVLEHIQDPINAINEMKRILKKEGILIIAVPNFRKIKDFYDDYTHIRPYTKKALFRLLKDNNFKEIRINNGILRSRIISAIFFFIPKLRYTLEKLLGKMSSFEIIATAINDK